MLFNKEDFIGYTHYWDIKKKIPAKLVKETIADLNKILEHSKKILGDGMGEGKLVISKTKISFNGIGEMSHETFSFEGTDSGFQFCKTAQKPYDKVVTACLTVMAQKLQKYMTVSSDGGPEDWEDGVKLANKVLGDDTVYYNPFIPQRIHRSSF